MSYHPSIKELTIAEIQSSLLTRFGSPEVPLKDISKEVLNLAPRTAYERAAKHKLPFPAHRIGKRAPWFVTIEDVAKTIWQLRRDARTEWQSVQTH